MMIFVDGAVYRNHKTNEERILLGLKMRTVALSDAAGHIEISHSEFESDYTLTDKHNHEEFCCMVHDIHALSGIHRGCLLR